MIIENELVGKKIVLRSIMIEDCNEQYVKWLNDEEVNQYLETRWVCQDIMAIKTFVKTMINAQDSYLFAIIEKETKRHVGNIKIGPINFIHKFADISYFIGDKESWGKGYATEAISILTNFAFSILNLNRVEAGAYFNNIASIKALKKNGYVCEGRYRNKVLSGGQYVDIVRFGILYSEWENRR